MDREGKCRSAPISDFAVRCAGCGVLFRRDRCANALTHARGVEGKFGGFRCNRLAASNTINFTLKGASEKVAADFRREEAKAATRPLGMYWDPPKSNKKQTYRVSAIPSVPLVDWRDDIDKLDSMPFHEVNELLESDYDAALVDTQNIFD